MSMNVVFFHVGEDIQQPTQMVQSLRLCDPTARVIQCTDSCSVVIPGVNQTVRLAYPSEGKFMIERIQAFSLCNLNEPAIYIDTDMLWLKKINIEESLGSRVVLLCQRSFFKDDSFNTALKRKLKNPQTGVIAEVTLTYEEHSGKTVFEVFPYIACFTVAASSAFWFEILDVLRGLPQKYRDWYGDQEALRIFVERTDLAGRLGFVPESVVACLPEFTGLSKSSPPCLLHFKGAKRKNLMTAFLQGLVAGRSQ